MSSSVKARLIIIVLAGTAGSLAAAEDLRGPETFASITNQSERSRALFVEAGRVLQHPRCLNCHPVGERPTQGNDGHPHSPPVVRGVDDKGAGQPSAKQGPDYTGVGNSGSAADGDPANVTVMVRAERSGTDKAGRQYVISVHCSDTAHSGDAMATVTVPHDMGNHTGTSTKSASRPASSSSSLAFGGGALSLPKL